MVWTCNKIQWALQDHPARNSPRTEEKGEAEETVDRQHQGMDRNDLCRDTGVGTRPWQMGKPGTTFHHAAPLRPERVMGSVSSKPPNQHLTHFFFFLVTLDILHRASRAYHNYTQLYISSFKTCNSSTVWTFLARNCLICDMRGRHIIISHIFVHS